MAYNVWSVVFGEQPSAAKWNLLGGNDAEFNGMIQRSGSGINLMDSDGNELMRLLRTASAVNQIDITNKGTGVSPTIAAAGETNLHVNIVPNGTGHVQKNGRNIDGMEELARTVLGGTADSITLSSIPLRKFNILRIYLIGSGGIGTQMTFNADSGANYSRRNEVAGSADTLETSQNYIQTTGTASDNEYVDAVFYQQANQEKIISINTFERGTTGASNAPVRRRIIGKWANTANAITSIILTNGGAGDYAAGSEAVLWGTD